MIDTRENSGVRVERDAGGVPHVYAERAADLHWGMGFCHAHDRGIQMLLMRILGRGQLSEFLDSSDESLAIDTFFRRINFRGHLDEQLDGLDREAERDLLAYVAGVNACFSRKIPWELRLAGYKKAEAWTTGDCVLLARMAGYLTLAQSQGEIERLVVEMLQAGTDPFALEELFPGQLGGLDASLVALIKKLTLGERIVPEEVRWGTAIPRMMASNNWVIAGSRTKSGAPMLANDPHLETNRLPNVWSEMALHQGDHYGIGATMPGLPGLLVGRTPQLAWGATYSFMDAIDSWIEDCKDGSYRRGQTWHKFEVRTETIVRKGKPPVDVTFYENDHGVLDGDPNQPGHYLSTRWASGKSGAKTINASNKMFRATTVTEGQALLGQLETAWNWVLADRNGDIGFQMSGLMPKRRSGVSGLLPLPGWDADNDWQGMCAPEDLPRTLNPECGYFVTANQDLNEYGNANPINAPMGTYRCDRISELIEAAGKMAPEDNIAIQYDVVSRQAAMFLDVLRPLLPDTDNGKTLRDWDCRYDLESKGAWLFERVYTGLLHAVFGVRGFGAAVSDHLATGTGVFIDFYQNFDCVLLSDESRWFGGQARDDIFREVLADKLVCAPRPWSDGQHIPLSHMLFGGKMPRWLGFDRGPIAIPGGRATPHQGQIYTSAGRLTSFTPSMRFFTDMSTDEIHSNMVGGPSDRRFSKWYLSDLKNWQTQNYKTTRGRV